MISMDADRAIRSDDGHLHLLRDSTQDRDCHRPNERPLNDAAGSIQIIRSSSKATSDTANPFNPSDPAMYDDGLSAVRGMLLGVVLGIGFWTLIGGLVGILFF
jgi:hypothetical protein